jgi:hypothetical protein
MGIKKRIPPCGVLVMEILSNFKYTPGTRKKQAATS